MSRSTANHVLSRNKSYEIAVIHVISRNIFYDVALPVMYTLERNLMTSHCHSRAVKKQYFDVAMPVMYSLETSRMISHSESRDL